MRAIFFAGPYNPYPYNVSRRVDLFFEIAVVETSSLILKSEGLQIQKRLVGTIQSLQFFHIHIKPVKRKGRGVGFGGGVSQPGVSASAHLA